jgi:hypothetical protein
MRSISLPFLAALLSFWPGQVIGWSEFSCHGAYGREIVQQRTTETTTPSRHILVTDASTLSRRRALQQAIVISISLTVAVQPTLAQESSKPRAPLENLLPAVRVKLLIDESVELATKAATEKQDKLMIQQLSSLLLEPHSFLTAQEQSTAKRYLEIDTLSDWTRARQKEAETSRVSAVLSNAPPQFDNPLARLNEGFEQWGERRQFGRLQKQQIQLEQSNPMRAAFNAYTNNLVFGDSYLLNADKATRSRMIRQYDQLPDVTSVIRSDLDLRDLYRNQILTSTDDARAELNYQLEQQEKGEEMDLSELIALLKEAQTSCNKWFEFVDENDLKEAKVRVLAENGI